jgi:SHS2 domain-containing protein
LLMLYRFLEDIGTADIAFEATGCDLPELFIAAADATMNVMIDNLDAIESRETRQIELPSDKIDMLLFDFCRSLFISKTPGVLYCEPARCKSTIKTKHIF